MSLKFACFNRLLSDTVNFQFWSTHLSQCFVIPLCDVLNCNLHYSEIQVLFRDEISTLPPFWKDMFTKWFDHFFIRKDCITDEDRKKVLSTPVLYNSEIKLDKVWTSPHLHSVLSDNNVLLLKPFLDNFVMIFDMIKIVDPATATMVAQLRTAVPIHWTRIVTHNRSDTIPPPCPITDHLFAGLMTPKMFTQLLLPRVRNITVITKWQKDLDCEIESFLWDSPQKS